MTKRPLLVLAGLSLLASACASGSPPSGNRRLPLPSPSVTASPSSSPAPSPSPSPADVDPLTGLGPRPTVPVVVIKVDNALTARPYQRGLGGAAVVYQELVEAGETRLAAVFSTAPSMEVGPIRSVRESDIELLREYGRVPVAFSGGNRGVKATFAQAVHAGWLRDASYDAVPDIYRLGEWRPDARNFFTTPAKIAAVRPGVAARDIGLRFGGLPAVWGTPAAQAKAVFPFGYVTVRAQYDPQTRRWAIFEDGRQVPGAAPTNVIVQRVPIHLSRYVDVLGAPTPYTTSVGSGAVTVLRDGRAMTGRWRRLNTTTGTRFLDGRGRDIPLRPGSTWILLLPSAGSLSVG